MTSDASGDSGSRDATLSEDTRLPLIRPDANSDVSDNGDVSVDASADARDGGASFCPQQGACRIMPLGDSITFADLPPGAGYRVEVFHLALANHKSIEYVGSQNNGPPTVDGQPFPRQSEGHSGYVISGNMYGIAELTDAALAKFEPNVVLLMIGTNDVNGSRDLPNAPSRLAALLDRIVRGAPNALLVVAQIIPTKSDAINVRVRAFNAAIPALIEERVAKGKHIRLVDMYGAFMSDANYKNTLLRDDLHPNAMGYGVMGRTWYAAISDVLTNKP